MPTPSRVFRLVLVMLIEAGNPLWVVPRRQLVTWSARSPLFSRVHVTPFISKKLGSTGSHVQAANWAAD